jgi:hypothetical protein
MKQCPKRGVIDPATLIVVCILCLTGVISADKFKNLFNGDSKAKKEAGTLVVDVGATKAAADAAAQKQAQLDAATRQKADLQHENVRGVVLALQKEKNPSTPVQVAATFAATADASFDALPPSEAAEIASIVDKLTAQDAVDRAAGAAEAASLQAKLDAAAKTEVSLRAENSALQSKASTLLNQTVEDSKGLAKWAADNKTLLQRIKEFTIWACITGGLFLLVFHVLPIAAKFFPALAPLAKGISAVAAFPLHALHSAETEYHKLAADAANAKLAVTQAALTAEQAAHAATSATLVKVATSP